MTAVKHLKEREAILIRFCYLLLCLMKEHLLACSNPHDLSLSLILANTKGGVHRIVHIQLATQSFRLIQRCKHIQYTHTESGEYKKEERQVSS